MPGAGEGAQVGTGTWASGPLAVLAAALLWGLSAAAEPLPERPSGPAGAARRVLYVASYHVGYPWSDGILAGLRRSLGLPDTARGDGVQVRPGLMLRTFHLDTKRRPDEPHKRQAALEARAIIAEWRPEVVVTSDDNAAAYLIAPYFRGAPLPFVFCGVNWDASPYGFPAPNVTGMEEVQPIDQIVSALRPYARGPRVAYLKGNDESARVEARHFEREFVPGLDARFVADFAAWCAQYRRLQQEADLLLLGNPASIPDWDAAAAEALVAAETRIPTGNWDAWMAPFALATFATVPEEQGEWAGGAALRILGGAAPAEIPVARNRRARVLVNMGLAKRLGVRFPMELLERATFVEEIPRP